MRKLLEELFALYYRDVYMYLYGLSHDPILAEDLTSEVFLEVLKSIATFRGEADIKTWIITIARRRWFAYLTRKKRQLPTGEWTDMLISGKTPEDQFLKKELVKRFYELLDSEPDRTRKIVRMRLEGQSFQEIGKVLGVSGNSARVIHFRAKEKIQKMLIKEGLLDE